MIEYETRPVTIPDEPEDNLKAILLFKPMLDDLPPERRPITLEEAFDHIRTCRCGACEQCSRIKAALDYANEYVHREELERALFEINEDSS